MPSIRVWLAPPRVEDPEQELRAKIIHWLLVTAILFLVPLTILLPIVEDDARYSLPLYVISLAGAAGLLVLAHRGWIQTACVMLAGLGWLVTLWASFASGGVGSAQLSMGVLVIMFTGFLFRGPAAIGMALLISVSLMGIEFGRDQGLFPEPFIDSSRFTKWAALSTVLAISAVFLQIFVGVVHSARREAAEKSKRLEEEMRLRIETEASLHRAQKLEALGRLSGGIAHDFNNILTVMLGETEMLEEEEELGCALPAEAAEHVSEIRASAERARALTQQLLAFSRHPVGVADIMDPDRALEALEPMLRRLIREDVTLRVAPGAKGATVRIDVGQFEQIVMNLVLNASDAMPRGGELMLASERIHQDAQWAARHAASGAGHYVSVEVSDTGSGIAAEDLGQIFDPFFTTKRVGEGTGLGLASTHGIVREAGGDITVESDAARGTTFRVFLPETTDSMPHAVAVPSGRVEAEGRGTLLLCEDDESVRKITRQMLTRAGYKVVAVDCAERALEWLRTNDTHVELLISDVIMPGVNGGELARRVVEERPGISVLLVSGYTSNVLEASGVSPDIELLEKPFTATALLKRVEALLSSESRAV